MEQSPPLKLVEERGEDDDLPVPVPGRPYLPELRVEGFVKLVLDVCVVGGVPGSDLDVRDGEWRRSHGGGGGGEGGFVGDEEEEARDGEGEEGEEVFGFHVWCWCMGCL